MTPPAGVSTWNTMSEKRYASGGIGNCVEEARLFEPRDHRVEFRRLVRTVDPGELLLVLRVAQTEGQVGLVVHVPDHVAEGGERFEVTAVVHRFAPRQAEHG